jgi:hypothetical protein
MIDENLRITAILLGWVNMTGMRGQHEQEWGGNMVRNLQMTQKNHVAHRRPTLDVAVLSTHLSWHSSDPYRFCDMLFCFLFGTQFHIGLVLKSQIDL